MKKDLREQPDRTGQQVLANTQEVSSGTRHLRHWLWLLLILPVIFLILALLLFISNFGSIIGSSITTSLPPRTFTVGAEPHLVVNDFAGIVTFHADSNSIVSINAIEHTRANNPDPITYATTQNGNAIHINISLSNDSSSDSESVDLDVTLPSKGDIQVTLGSGNIETTGISGLMNLQTNAGNVSFQDGTIRGTSSFLSGAGSVLFDGSLTSGGNYKFETQAGSIDLALPSDSAFVLDVSTSAGEVSNEFNSNTVGVDPTSQLYVHTDAGNVDVHQS